jgi:hypothetical protein
VLFVALFVATLGAGSGTAAHHGPAVPVDYCLTVVLGSVLLFRAGETLFRRPAQRLALGSLPALHLSAVSVPPAGRIYRPPLPTETTILRC